MTLQPAPHEPVGGPPIQPAVHRRASGACATCTNLSCQRMIQMTRDATRADAGDRNWKQDP
ncbi:MULTISPECIES: hypothetical protein [Paracoccus]|uniref:Uncharacterized protein n=1 Tax=Paracoccus litorisediminis TaxID=2006130 RepID=A0A844HI70_9RHOB|nr:MULTISPECIES: hypothetical protein [Paracoccus]MBD9527034.1 hypothetical protein [Paracoccus sp. PAR01]MTH59536.1 hypothetical protein [Paracoccus litorisediminis]